jgi:hypothetical protein
VFALEKTDLPLPVTSVLFITVQAHRAEEQSCFVSAKYHSYFLRYFVWLELCKIFDFWIVINEAPKKTENSTEAKTTQRSDRDSRFWQDLYVFPTVVARIPRCARQMHYLD